MKDSVKWKPNIQEKQRGLNDQTDANGFLRRDKKPLPTKQGVWEVP